MPHIAKNPTEKTLLDAAPELPTETPTAAYRSACLSAATGFEDIPVFQRQDLPAGFRLVGPAIVEQADTTTMIYPDHRAEVDRFGNLIIDL